MHGLCVGIGKERLGEGIMLSGSVGGVGALFGGGDFFRQLNFNERSKRSQAGPGGFKVEWSGM